MHTHYIFESAGRCATAASAVPEMPSVVWNLAALGIMSVIQRNPDSNLLPPLLQLVYNYTYLGWGLLVANSQSRLCQGSLKQKVTVN